MHHITDDLFHAAAFPPFFVAPVMSPTNVVCVLAAFDGRRVPLNLQPVLLRRRIRVPILWGAAAAVAAVGEAMFAV